MGIADDFIDSYTGAYRWVQSLHYKLAEDNVLYRVISLTIMALLAPLIVLVLWIPLFLTAYLAELGEFYKYLPDGFKGKRRPE